MCIKEYNIKIYIKSWFLNLFKFIKDVYGYWLVNDYMIFDVCGFCFVKDFFVMVNELLKFDFWN